MALGYSGFMFHPTRQFIIAALAAAATLLAPSARAAADEDALIRRAFVYAFPIHEMGRLLLGGAPAATGAMPRFVHRRVLASAADRGVTTPNNDTLYSSARLNLAAGPVKLAVPDTQGRYYSVAFVDAATDNFATLGQRTTGTRAGEFLIVGPDWVSPLPDGARVIRAPGNDVLVLLRIVVQGPSDVAAVQRLQDGFTLTAMPSGSIGPAAAASSAASAPAAAEAPAARPDQPAAAERFLAIVNRMLARNPPPSYERVLLERFAPVGVCGAGCSWDALPPPVQARWNALLPDMMTQLQRRAHDNAQRPNGWSAPKPAIGDFGTDYELRAETALTGLLALAPAEAMYFTAREDGAHHALTGTHVYRLHLPPGSIPVDGFWSLTMYEQNFDGRLYLVNNPIDRYAIGDRTPGLRRNRDGSIDIWIQRAEPGRSRRANWLPAPPGPFVLTLRAYEPRLALRDGRFVLPPVESVE
jgi:hypothetical protein